MPPALKVYLLCLLGSLVWLIGGGILCALRGIGPYTIQALPFTVPIILLILLFIPIMIYMVLGL